MPAAAPAFSASSWRRAATGSPASTSRPAMLAEARRKAAAQGAPGPLRGGRRRADCRSARGSFDLVDQPPCAVDPAAPRGGDRRVDPGAAAGRAARRHRRAIATRRPAAAAGATAPGAAPNTRAIGDRLPFLGGRPREEIEALLRAHGLVDVGERPARSIWSRRRSARMVEEGLEPRRRRRYVVWGDRRP